MSALLFYAGLSAAVIGFGGRLLLKNQNSFQNVVKTLPIDSFSKYFRGGFEVKMTKREASLILGISPTAKPEKVNEAYRRLMIGNHPDLGGSPYLAQKINEAKDLLNSKRFG